MNRHFGDARYFDIYSITENNSILIQRAVNLTGKEDIDVHADPVVDDIQIYESIKMIQDSYKEIKTEWFRGETRGHISMKNKGLSDEEI